MIDPRTRRPEEGWLSLALVALLIAIVASAVDDPAWVNGRSRLTDGLVVLGMLGVAVGFIGPKVGWSRWTTHLVGALFAGPAHPDRRGLVRAQRRVDRRRLRGDGPPERRGVSRPRLAPTAVHDPGAPLRARAGHRDLGHRAVRVVRRVRPSPPVERRDHDRRRPAREHVDDAARRAAVPRGVHRRVAVPADPDARVRRAGDVDPAPDRRSQHDLVALSPRRHRVHPGRPGGVAGAHRPGRLEPARRRLGRGARPAPRRRRDDRAIPARRRGRQGQRRELRVERPDRGEVVPGREHCLHRDPAGGYPEGPVLAGGHVRHVQPLGLGSDESPRRAGRGRRPAHGGNRGEPQGRPDEADHVHHAPGRLPRQRAALAGHADEGRSRRARSRWPATRAGSRASSCPRDRATTRSTPRCCASTTPTSSAATA